MPSLADLIRFSQLSAEPSTATPTSTPADLDAAYATVLQQLALRQSALADPSQLWLQGVGSVPSAPGAGFVFPSQFSIPATQGDGVPSVVSPSLSGGILGNHPIATGDNTSPYRLGGILPDLNDPRSDWWAAHSQSVDEPASLSPVGRALASSTSTEDVASDQSNDASGTSPPSTGAQPTASRYGEPLASPFVHSSAPGGYDIEHPEHGAQDTHFPVSAQIHHPQSADWSGFSIDRAQRQATSPSDEAGIDDWPAHLQRAQYVDKSAITGDSRIDGMTQLLIETLAQSAASIGQSVPHHVRANVFGIQIHSDFAKRVESLDLPGIGQKGIEQSWSAGGLVDYGIAGSIRTDVYLKDRFGHILAIYDVKTGNARLTPRRIEELRRAVGRDDIPVIELRYGDLTALQR